MAKAEKTETTRKPRETIEDRARRILATIESLPRQEDDKWPEMRADEIDGYLEKIEGVDADIAQRKEAMKEEVAKIRDGAKSSRDALKATLGAAKAQAIALYGKEIWDQAEADAKVSGLPE